MSLQTLNSASPDSHALFMVPVTSKSRVLKIWYASLWTRRKYPPAGACSRRPYKYLLWKLWNKNLVKVYWLGLFGKDYHWHENVTVVAFVGWYAQEGNKPLTYCSLMLDSTTRWIQLRNNSWSIEIIVRIFSKGVDFQPSDFWFKN